MNKNSRKITFRYDLLSQNDMKIGEIDVISGSIALNSLAELKRTGRFTIKENIAKHIDFLNNRVKPIVIIDGVETEMGVYLMPSPTRRLSNGRIYRDIEAYDVLQILKEDKVTDRIMFKKGTKYETIIKQIINSAGIYRCTIEPTELTLKRDREFEIGTSKLTICNQLLQEINYTALYSDKTGLIRAKRYIMPNMRNIELKYIENDFDIKIRDSSTDELDLFNVPNVWVVVASNGENESLKSIYENNNAADKTSILSRGRKIVDYREISDIADQAALNQYTKRLATNALSIYRKIEFETMINPIHGYANCIYIEDKALDISDKYIETSWEIPLEVGGIMKHRARKVIMNVR